MVAKASPAPQLVKKDKVTDKKMTKRQKRKQVNETNKWPQHPKIQDMEVRSKAYIRVAGLGSSTKKKDTVDPKLDLMSPEVKFGRLLGSTDQRKRHLAVQKLKEYLRARCDIHNENGGVSEMDLLKLWKGLWYTLYMADKAPVQEELSKHLADLLWCVAGTEEEDEYAGEVYMQMCEDEEREDYDDEGDEDSDDPEVTLEEVVNTLEDADDSDEDDESASNEDGAEMEDEEMEQEEGDDDEDSQGENDEEDLDDSEMRHCRGAHLASLFIRTFFRTVRREWGNMDKYRVDKFYSLSRMYMHEIFKYMATRHWNLGIIRLFNDAIFEEVLNEKPNGLRYHLIDIALDELAKVNGKAPMPLTEATFLDTMEPYLAMCQTGAGGDDSVQRRVMEHVLEKFLNKYSVVGDVATSENEADEKAKELIFDQVHVGTLAQFIFELASDPETKDKYRKSLYDMHKDYMRRLKKVGKDISLDDEKENDCEKACCKDSPTENHGGSEEAKTTKENNVPSSKNDEKKRKRSEAKSAGGDDADGILTPATQCQSKRKRKKNKEREDETIEVTTKPTSKVTLAPPTKGKNMKDGHAKPIKSKDEQDEVVTISLVDQRKAKKEDKKAHKKEMVATAGSDSDDKRVKWRPTNKSKSYKASIKGLMTANPPKTSAVTPEKSILLNKGKVPRPAATTKAARKRAVNYF